MKLGILLLAGLLQAPVTPPPTPQLTELEKTKIELFLTQEQLLQQQYNILITNIQSNHPGYLYNPQTKALVPIPKPTPEEKPKEPTPSKK